MRNLLFLTCVLAHFLKGSNAQRYEAIHSNIKLPAPIYSQRAIYDGLNSIYLIGGYIQSGSTPTQILKYNIVTDSIEEPMGAILPTYAFGFTVQQNRDGDIFIFGAGANNNYIFKFNPGTSSIENVGFLPYDIYYASSVKYYDISNSVFIFGGFFSTYRDAILEYDMAKNTAEPRGRLTKRYIVNDAVGFENYAYIFGRSESEPTGESITKINMDNWESESGPNELPIVSGYSSLVSDGKSIFICGGYEPTSQWPAEGLIHIDPVTLNSTFIPVDNFVPSGISPAVVYVERLNRIYFFGGMDGDFVNSLDDIWWIDLPRSVG